MPIPATQHLKSADHFRIAYFDKPQRELFEQMALKEQLVSRKEEFIFHDDDTFSVFEGKAFEKVKKAKLAKDTEEILDIIMLFKSVDAAYSTCRWDKLIEMGVTPDSPRVHKDAYSDDIESNPHLRDESVYHACKRRARLVFQGNPGKVIGLSSKSSLEALKEVKGTKPSDLTDFRRLCKAILSDALRGLESSQSLGETRSRFGWRGFENSDLYDLFVVEPFLLGLESLFKDYVEGLYFSSLQGGCFYSSISPKQSDVKEGTENKAALDLLRTVRFDFGRQIILPKPSSIEEAIEFRELNQVKRLREVLNEWCLSLVAGDEALQNKICSDVSRATSDLMRVRRLKEFRKSPYFITLNLVGGQVPVFSNLLSFVNAGLDLYQSHVEKRTSWIGK